MLEIVKINIIILICINPYFTPFLETSNNDTNILITFQTNENIDVLVNNKDNFLSTMVKSREKKKLLLFLSRVIDKYNLGLNKLYGI